MSRQGGVGSGAISGYTFRPSTDTICSRSWSATASMISARLATSSEPPVGLQGCELVRVPAPRVAGGRDGDRVAAEPDDPERELSLAPVLPRALEVDLDGERRVRGAEEHGPVAETLGVDLVGGSVEAGLQVAELGLRDRAEAQRSPEISCAGVSSHAV